MSLLLFFGGRRDFEKAPIDLRSRSFSHLTQRTKGGQESKKPMNKYLLHFLHTLSVIYNPHLTASMSIQNQGSQKVYLHMFTSKVPKMSIPVCFSTTQL